MDKMYQGIIYTIKREGHSREAIADFMHNFTDTPKEYYTNYIINQLLEQTMSAAVRENQYPSSILYEYFNWKHEPWNYDEFNAMCAALSSIQVREKDAETGKYNYINGFKGDN